ncbi:MAG TPA: GNAT family N-acetyltransferase [Gemmatimonadaceae bacterium]|nr:GNAT family N-acetyltransferase [Gemmatimonadaceae bacterium]
MPTQPEIRWTDATKLTPAQADAILQLLARAFPNWPNLDPPVDPRDHFKWKVHDFPGGATLGVTEVESRVIGFAAILRRTWLVKGERVAVNDTVDLAVDPDWRGQGVYSRMFRFGEEHVDRNFDMSLAYVTKSQTVHVAKGRGYRSPGNPVRALIRARSVLSVARRARQGGSLVPVPFLALGALGHKVMNRTRYAFHRQQGPQCSIRTVDGFDARLDKLLQAARGEFDLMQERGAAYLNWRYACRAGGQFTIRLAESGEELLGYIVTRVSGEQGYIADLLALPSRRDVAESLLRDALARLDASADCDVSSWLPRLHPYAELFRRAGFVDPRRDSGAAYRPLRLGEDRLAFLSNRRARIHLMIGDSDHV